MDSERFDAWIRAIGAAAPRRTTLLGLAAAALVAPLSGLSLEDAAAKKNHKKHKKKKCRKLNQDCGGKKKKCCKGLTCTDGTCLNPQPPECVTDADCGADEICQNGQCVPEAPECENNSDCDSDEICQDGECVPVPPECTEDSDCGDNEVCLINGSCAISCTESADCPTICGSTCGLANTEGQQHCIDTSGCATQTCTSTADCPLGSQCSPCGGENVCNHLCDVV